MSIMKTVDFKTSAYFSGFITFTGVLLVVVALATLNTHPILSVIFLSLSIVIFTTHYRLKIDFENKTYHDYLWILGFRNGDRGRFEFLDCLIIKKSRVSQTMNSRGSSSTIHKDTFDAYLTLSGNRKIHLLTNDDRETVIKFLKDISSRLHVRIIDHSSGEPIEVSPGMHNKNT